MKSSSLLAGAALSLLAACGNDRAFLTAPATPSARFEVEVSADAAGPMLSAVAANVCADVSGGTASPPAPGAPMQAWTCHGGANQQLALQPSGAVTAYGGALCLDVWGAQANDGDAVVAWPCHGGANQRWTRTPAGELRTAVNGKCLDLWGARAVDGARLVIWPCHGGSNQRWTAQESVAVEAPVAAPVVPAAPVGSDPEVGGSAELPRVYLNTAMPAVTGRTINVGAGGDLQAALDAAQPGDQVVIAAGATFVGNFALNPKAGMTGAQWITVRSAGALPAEGTRVGPADAAQMARLLTPNVAPALKTEPGAQGWRVVGVELGLAPGVPWAYTLAAFGSIGSEQNTPAQVPSRIVLDRSYLHASFTTDVRRCITLNSASTAVIDSYVADCHSRDSESQAITGWNGPGPFKIVNNHIEGGHEVIALGGGDPNIANLIPSDVEIRRNHVIRPMSWRGVWPAKNLVEFKAGQRILLEANVFENNWVDAQSGFAFVWWSANADGGALWSVTQDITFRYNRVSNVANGFNLADRYNGSLPRMSRVTIAHNTVTGIDGGRPLRMFQVIGTVNGLTIANNSALASYYDLVVSEYGPAGVPDLVFRNNIVGSEYSIYTSPGFGQVLLDQLRMPAANMTGNVIAAGQGSRAVPAGNTFAPSVSAIGLVDFAGGNFQLSASSPFLTSGTNGSTPGANVAALNSAISGVVR